MSRIAEAAEAIHALINSSPRTPSPKAIAAVLEAHKALPAPRENYVASEWYRALDQHLKASSRATTDEEDDALDGRLGSVAKAICAERVRTLDDLVVRAAIAVHWSGCDFRNPYPDCTERYALAAVVRGVLDLTGLKFDDDGRLL
jgi:hypothetical protein